ncbi:hypothetical protein FNW52_10495 [Flavobacterium sp. ZT3R18]|uniref:hypothetical protein n=1 Tax=Flavobacterium sp. ZT3R18 TaxID=2594429 RepID=UPI00117ACD24|nr:hypothetical protein [Flavobacterium sp. ZT3R18]TRX35463.1 hypothetical protein FNW52_10495 [Flavobacterium sp. ZT3R18]
MKGNNTFFKIILSVLLIGFFQNVRGQKTQENIPEWIKMMNDPNVVYFDAVSNFDNYWKNKEKPVGEEEIFEAKDSKIRNAKNEEIIPYTFEYKKFILWQKINLAFVKKDGTILTQKERLEMWEKEKKARN